MPSRSRLRYTALVAAAAVAVPLLGACSGAGHPSPTPSSGAGSAVGASPVAAARWWSNDAVTAGSVVGANDDAVAKLSASRPQYCAMLRDTIAAGKSVLPGATATSPALATTTNAFVSELLKVAPPEIAPAWQVLAPVIVAVVRSGGSFASLAPRIDTNAVASAAAKVSQDATAMCHLSLATK